MQQAAPGFGARRVFHRPTARRREQPMNIPGPAARAARPLQVLAYAPAVRRPHRGSARMLWLRRALFLAVAFDFGRTRGYGRRSARHLDGPASR